MPQFNARLREQEHRQQFQLRNQRWRLSLHHRQERLRKDDVFTRARRSVASESRENRALRQPATKANRLLAANHDCTKRLPRLRRRNRALGIPRQKPVATVLWTRPSESSKRMPGTDPNRKLAESVLPRAFWRSKATRTFGESTLRCRKAFAFGRARHWP